MKNQFITLCFTFVLAFSTGCSQPVSQQSTGTGITGPIDNPQPPAVPGEDENTHVVTTPHGPVQPQVRTEQDQAMGSAASPGKIEDMQGQVLNRMMPEIATVLPYDHGRMPYINPASIDRENYAHFDDNPVKRVSEQPVSTFSIDVDTGSYAVVRRMLNHGQLPQHDAVRSEELINYFSYDYPERAERSTPFAVHREIAPTPWNQDTYLLHIGIKGFEQERSTLPPANLVFLVDVSGSMQDPNKLELLKTSLKLLTRQLREVDTIALVVYAGASGIVLEPTKGNQQAKIITALDRLQAGGSTNGAAGIELAYAMAEQAFIPGGINRVLLATDGDFNVGTVNIEQLKDLITEKRKSGIALSTLGFGAGNYNDALMEQIADIGNGNYAYIDTLNEARKVLVEEMSATMLSIAKDVKIQIEFNPAVVAEYRLIGYENRILNREDFNNDKVDAGEIGAGHTVTAIYEVALVGSSGEKIDPLRYQSVPAHETNSDEMAFLRLRYKAPDSDSSDLLEWVVTRESISPDIAGTSDDYRFAAAVAGFAQLLRGGEQLGEYVYADILDLARGARGSDPFGYRGEFLSLIQLADSLSAPVSNSGQQVGLREE